MGGKDENPDRTRDMTEARRHDVQETVGSLLVTALAVAGTLVSALLAQRHAGRSMTRELDRLDRRRVEERQERARQSVLESHRAGYTAFNSAARRYLTALTNHLHALRLGTGVEAAAAELRRARAEHADCYAELQLVAPDTVLTTAREVNRALNHVYGTLLRLAHGAPLADDSLDAAQAEITGLWDRALAELRTRMRRDLGLTGAL